MDNPQIAQVFADIAGLLEMKDESVFTIRAYQTVARIIEDLPAGLDQIVREGRDLKEIPGIGQAIAKKITELSRPAGSRTTTGCGTSSPMVSWRSCVCQASAPRRPRGSGRS